MGQPARRCLGHPRHARYRFGIESLLGLRPVAGDLVGAALGLSIVWQAPRVAAPRSLQLPMLANLGIDLVIGAVPIVGDIADVACRKNQRNAALLENWQAKQARRG